VDLYLHFLPRLRGLNRATITFTSIPREELTDYCRQLHTENLQNFTFTIIILKGIFKVIEYVKRPCKLWWEIHKDRRQFDDLGVEGRVIL